jgi:hypothetical protein
MKIIAFRISEVKLLNFRHSDNETDDAQYVDDRVGNFRQILCNVLGTNSPIFLCAAFLYESFAQSFFVLEVKVKLFIGTRKLAQFRS